MNIDLKSTKIYLISPGVNKYRERALIVLGRLIDEGYKNITFFKSLPGPNNTASLTNTVLEIFKTEMSNTEPFIILEDDCTFFHKYDSVQVPEDFDSLYLGLSLWAYPFSIHTLYKKPRPNIVAHSIISLLPFNNNLVRILSMTGGHAILFRSRKFMKQFIDNMAEISQVIDDLPHDLLYAVISRNYKIYALRKPLFYQDGTLGGLEEATKIEFL